MAANGMTVTFDRWGSSVITVALLLLASSCRDDVIVEEGLTGVDLTISYAFEVDQLMLEVGADDDSAFSLPPIPERARLMSPEGESVVILLDESLDEQLVTVRARGSRDGVQVGAGLVVVAIQRRELVAASIELGAPAICGDGSIIAGFEECDDENIDDGDGCSRLCTIEEEYSCEGEPSRCHQLCADVICEEGQRCDLGSCICDDLSCPIGCCSSGRCHLPSMDFCGIGGEDCRSCSSERSEACSIEGECFCGEETECSPGERCDNGMCVCDDESCAGCCSETGCERRSFEQCGVNGGTCVTCDQLAANTCTPEGLCQCGSGDACRSGQRCISGTCSCDEISCPDGCCEDGECSRPPTLGTCGIRGGTCQQCDEETADRCLDGSCSCGDGPSCRSGQRCSGEECLCDALSCPDGCCLGSSCVTPSFENCGASGQECASCDPSTSDQCSEAGFCLCGGVDCSPGQRCVDSRCVCDWTTCDGCCDALDQCRPGTETDECGTGGSSCDECMDSCSDGICSGCASTCSGCCGPICRSNEFPTCGSDGATCRSCDPVRSNQCDAEGDCSCSGNPPCENGQECIDGSCDCTDLSCPVGCCQDNQCQPRDVLTCGIQGTSCIACDPDRSTRCSAAGECLCGTSPACQEGQRCVGDFCVCDSESCATGCCNGGICEELSPEACGPTGTSCRPCDLERSNGCDQSGECRCGEGPACEIGQHCSSGTCLCDGISCLGCCRDEVCLLERLDESCGSAGGLCEACIEPETCVGGSCTGCSSTSCPDGCCSGNSCRAPSLLTCGVGGEFCQACDLLLADRCSEGACRCGEGAPCEEGQHCILEDCVCDVLSCPFGCCDLESCRSLSTLSCAPLGEPCQPCETSKADNCSPQGECRCGPWPACGEEQECDAGRCR